MGQHLGNIDSFVWPVLVSFFPPSIRSPGLADDVHYTTVGNGQNSPSRYHIVHSRRLSVIRISTIGSGQLPTGYTLRPFSWVPLIVLPLFYASPVSVANDLVSNVWRPFKTTETFSWKYTVPYTVYSIVSLFCFFFFPKNNGEGKLSVLLSGTLTLFSTKLDGRRGPPVRKTRVEWKMRVASNWRKLPH